MPEKYNSMKELDESLPDKNEVAVELGSPLDQEHNENLTAQEVEEIFGKIGGAKIKKLIEMAKAQVVEKENH